MTPTFRDKGSISNELTIHLKSFKNTMESMGLKKNTTPLLLFSGPRSGLKNHQKYVRKR